MHYYSQLVKNVNSSERVGNRSGQGIPNFQAINAKNQLLLLPDPPRSLKRAMVDLGMPYSTIVNIEKKVVHMFPYQVSKHISYNNWIGLNEMVFLNCVWRTFRLNPNSLVHLEFPLNVFFSSQNLWTLTTLILWVPKPKSPITEITHQKRYSLVWGSRPQWDRSKLF